jgi:aminoglycoside phosphotransferase (APT) family kinase protein
LIKSTDVASFVEKKGKELLLPTDATDIHLTGLHLMQVQGQSSRVYVLSTSYRQRNCSSRKDFVLKTSRGNSEEAIVREYRALKALKPKGVPVPTAIALELDRSVIGAPFLIMEKIDGASTSNFFTNKANALATVDMLAELMASLHSVNPDILSETDLPEKRQVQEVRFRESVLSDLRGQISIGYITSLSPIIRRKYLKALKKLRESQTKGSQMTLIHADFGPDHVLLSDKGPVITDWEGIRIGDPAYDLGWLYHVVGLEGHIMIDHRFVKAPRQIAFNFGIGEEAVRRYKKYAGSVPENLEFYENLAALKLATTLDLHVRLGYASLSRVLRLKPNEVLSQTVFAYGAIRSFKENCESFLHERGLL